jgi:hypothetical protein
VSAMTRDEALFCVRDADYEPESYNDAAEIFAALYGRLPDDEDGDQGQVWSLCCAAVQS